MGHSDSSDSGSRSSGVSHARDGLKSRLHVGETIAGMASLGPRAKRARSLGKTSNYRGEHMSPWEPTGE